MGDSIALTSRCSTGKLKKWSENGGIPLFEPHLKVAHTELAYPHVDSSTSGRKIEKTLVRVLEVGLQYLGSVFRERGLQDKLPSSWHWRAVQRIPPEPTDMIQNPERTGNI